MGLGDKCSTRFAFKWTFFAERTRAKRPFEICPFIHAIKIVSSGPQTAPGNPLSPGSGWPEKVKGLARYVLSRSQNRSNCPALETGTINPSGANGSISTNNL
jgi:hypothetical protein